MSWKDEIERLGRRISGEFYENNRYLSPLLASYITQMIALNNESNYDLSKQLSLRDEIELVKQVKDEIDDKNKIADIATLRMQLVYHSAQQEQIEILKQQMRDKKRNYEAYIQKILQVASRLTSKDQVAELYRSLYDMLLVYFSRNNNNMNRQIEREIAAGLESVFPQSGLNAFNLLSSKQKEQHIRDLPEIILGIRLFNKYSKKGGAGLENIPLIVEQDIKDMISQLEVEYSKINQICKTYEKVIDLEYQRPGTIKSPLKRIQSELLYIRQFSAYLYKLYDQWNDSLRIVEDNIDEYNKLLTIVQSKIGARRSVPKDEIYPKFLNIARVWNSLEEHLNQSRSLRSVYTELLSFKDYLETALLEDDIDLSEKLKLINTQNDQSLDFVKNIPFDSEINMNIDNVMRVSPEHSQFKSLSLALQGYCPWTIVHRGGLAILGNPQLGTIVHKGMNYCFQSIEAMKEFCSDYERYTSSLLIMLRKIPALIHLVESESLIPNSSVHNLLKDISYIHTKNITAPGSKVDAGVQTPVHFVEEAIDPEYEWNEWNLRRQAIHLANLTNKKTHSTQTDKSHFKRDNKAQTYIKQHLSDGTAQGTGTQTGISKSTNVARTIRHVTGLRGKPNSKMKVVTLTIPPSVVDGTNRPLNKKSQEHIH